MTPKTFPSPYSFTIANATRSLRVTLYGEVDQARIDREWQIAAYRLEQLS